VVRSAAAVCVFRGRQVGGSPGGTRCTCRERRTHHQRAVALRPYVASAQENPPTMAENAVNAGGSGNKVVC